MKIDIVPDITMRGQADPYGRAAAPRQATVGQLATGLLDLAGRRADWEALIRYDPTRPSRVHIDTGRWLITWPPGHRAGLPAGPGAEVSALVAGELIEVTIGPDGVTERPMRTGRIRVHGAGAADDTRELHNPGATYAITLHARPC